MKNLYETYNEYDKFINSLLTSDIYKGINDKESYDYTLEDIASDFLGDWLYNVSLVEYYGYVAMYKPFGSPISDDLADKLCDRYISSLYQDFDNIFNDIREDIERELISNPDDSVKVSLV